MKLRPSVKKAIEQLHIEKLKKNQLKPINAILDGHDILVVAPTSYGKSLLYQIPAIIQKDAMTIVIEPLLALIHDQVQKLKNFNVSVAYLDSTQSKCEQKAIIDALCDGEVQILYIAPERLETGILSRIEKKNNIGMVVVDECHCCVSWGHTFRESYLTIGEYISQLKKRPVVVALTATALPEDRSEIMDLLSMQKVQTFEMSLYRSNLRFMKRMTPSRKEQLHELKRCLKKYRKYTAIVFCSTVHHAEGVAGELRKKYPDDVIVYHSREKHQEKAMLSSEKHIIVATSALSMGVDVRNVDLVIHYNMPMSLADYYQMAGRAGRDGQGARSIILYNPDDYYTNYALLRDIEDKSAKGTMLARLDKMKEFCEDKKHCMVKTVLQSLGDSYNHKCRYCTNCQRGR